MKLKFCALCGDTNNLEHHHVIPKSLGGSNKADNILTLCSKHHVVIHNMSDKRIHSAELIKAAKAKQKLAGIFTGGKTPFGYDNVDGVLIPKKSEQKIIKEILKLHESGMGLRGISKLMKSKYGIDKTFMGVKYIIKRANET